MRGCCAYLQFGQSVGHHIVCLWTLILKWMRHQACQCCCRDREPASVGRTQIIQSKRCGDWCGCGMVIPGQLVVVQYNCLTCDEPVSSRWCCCCLSALLPALRAAGSSMRLSSLLTISIQAPNSTTNVLLCMQLGLSQIHGVSVAGMGVGPDVAASTQWSNAWGLEWQSMLFCIIHLHHVHVSCACALPLASTQFLLFLYA